MRPGRFGRDLKRVADLDVRPAPAEQLKHLRLAFCENIAHNQTACRGLIIRTVERRLTMCRRMDRRENFRWRCSPRQARDAHRQKRCAENLRRAVSEHNRTNRWLARSQTHEKLMLDCLIEDHDSRPMPRDFPLQIRTYEIAGEDSHAAILVKRGREPEPH